MKKLIMTTVIAACLALCAAVWPQTKAVEEIPTTTQTPAVSAPEATVAELKTEVGATPSAEKEKAEVPQPEPLHETIHVPEPAPMEVPTAPAAQPTAESEVAQEVNHEPTTEPTPEPDNEQTVADKQSNDMVYVPGFGWIESQGPNQVEYAEDMYENGNKIGSMG